MKKPSVLVIDDEAVVRDLFIKLGKRRGFEVTVAENSHKAVEELKKKDFDVIFCDIMMPYIDGVQTLREIRKINCEIPVFMVTGSKDEQLIEEAIQEGVSGFIYKPFELNEVIDTIERHVKKDRGGEDNE